MTTPYRIVPDADGKRVLEIRLDDLSEQAQAIVGLDFNPSGDRQIDLAKAMAAGLAHLGVLGYESSPAHSLQQRAFEDGVRHLEAAQMFLVKAIIHRTKGR